MSRFRKKIHPTTVEIDTRTERLVARLEAVAELVEKSANETGEAVSRLDAALDRLETVVTTVGFSEDGDTTTE